MGKKVKKLFQLFFLEIILINLESFTPASKIRFPFFYDKNTMSYKGVLLGRIPQKGKIPFLFHLSKIVLKLFDSMFFMNYV